MDGIFVKTWDSIQHVKRELNLGIGGISNCLREKTYSAIGFQWRKYIGNTDNIEPCIKHATHKAGRKVDQLDKEGNVIATFKNQTEAARKLGMWAGNISAVCRGEYGSNKGCYFQFNDEELRKVK